MRTYWEPEEVQTEVLEIGGKEIEVDFLRYQTDADFDGDRYVGFGEYEIQIVKIKEDFQGIKQVVEVPEEIKDRIIAEIKDLLD
jgi:hypothetical protein